jgi:hypothetical protein
MKVGDQKLAFQFIGLDYFKISEIACCLIIVEVQNNIFEVSVFWSS